MEHANGRGVVSFEHGRDAAAAEARLVEFPIGRELTCFYRGSDVVLTNDFSTSTIVIVTIFGIFPLVCTLAMVCMRAGDCAAKVCGRVVDWPLVVLWFWLGIIIPYAILLPIHLWGAMTESAKSQLLVSVVVFSILFTLPGIVVAVVYLVERWNCKPIKMAEPIPMMPVAAEVVAEAPEKTRGETRQETHGDKNDEVAVL